jgi:hypothetical protein
MSMQYIRKHYGVPAKRGGRIVFNYKGIPVFGTITGSVNASLRIKLDGDKRSGIYHPTWELKYL